MKLKIFITTIIALLGTVLCSAVASAATVVPVNLPTYHVTVNGRYVDNYQREYPFIVYNGITYFPMTYNDCAFLGINNSWTPENGTVITVTESNGVYDDSLSPEENEDVSVINGNQLFYATVTEGAISVNGTPINNSLQQYPILTFREIPYFPLTWNWCQEFGWSNLFTDAGLSICSPEYASGLGYVNYYDVHGTSYSCPMYMIDTIYNGVYEGKYSFSNDCFKFMPDSKIGNFTPMYRVKGYDSCRYYIRNASVSRFNSFDYYTANQIWDVAVNMMDDTSMSRIVTSLEGLAYYDDDILFKNINEVVDILKDTYMSVWSYDMSKEKCIPRDQLQIYRNASWYTYDDLVLQEAKNLAARGEYPKAVLLCSLASKNALFDAPWCVPSFNIPFAIHNDTLMEHRSELTQLARIYSDANNANGGPLVAIVNEPKNYYGFTYFPANKRLADVDIHGQKFYLLFVNMGYSDVVRIDVQCDLFDGAGNKIHSGNFYFDAKESNRSSCVSATDYCSVSWDSNWADTVVVNSMKVTFARGESVTYYY